MKNKLLLFFVAITLCTAIQLKISFASENQSWSDYFRSKWTQFTKSPRAQALAVAPLAYSVQKVGPGIIVGTSQILGLTTWANSPWTYSFDNVPTALIWLIATISAIKLYRQPVDTKLTPEELAEQEKHNKINQMKEAVKIIIHNPLLYPTRSSKLHALLQRDEFEQYINDKDGLFQKACNELIEEINKIEYTEADKAIDEQMSKIRNMLKQYVTLDEQIKALESKEYSANIPEGMRAYLSVYYRLTNKQNVENQLSQEEKTSRQAWAKKAAKAKGFLESEDYHQKLQKKYKENSEKESLERIAEEEASKSIEVSTQ